MRAPRRVERDVTGLFESACEIARLEHRLQHRGAATRIGTQIAVAKAIRSEQWRSAGKSEDDVATRPRAIARRPEEQCVTRRHCLCELIDNEIKSAEMALGNCDLSFRHREIGCSRRNDRGGWPHQDSN